MTRTDASGGGRGTLYEPTLESLSQHAVPAWFDDAKLGIFVHWGPYSVPGWAARTEVDFTRPDWFAVNAYAEWYQNTLAIEGSPTRERHARVYGAGYPYARFGEALRDAMRGWDAGRWAELFAAAGARYVVPGTKHHDGFLMWPSAQPNPHIAAWQMERDVIGELAEAVRGRGMRFGLYYSGGLDWTFGGLPITDVPSMIRAIHQTDEYARYADGHWRELIARYRPDVLWNDIGYPQQADYHRLFADYYNAQADGVVNNRFDAIGSHRGTAHHDFYTPEYSSAKGISAKKWEACRGIGNSFGYNRNEDEGAYLGSGAIVHLLADTVSKNGNLLLNVGPTASGEIPWPQAERLLALGAWLRVNGAAIYGTRPWRVAEATSAEGCAVRFTARGETVYAIVLDPGEARTVTLAAAAGVTRARLLGYGAPLSCEAAEGGVRVTLPPGFETSPAIAVELSA